MLRVRGGFLVFFLVIHVCHISCAPIDIYSDSSNSTIPTTEEPPIDDDDGRVEYDLEDENIVGLFGNISTKQLRSGRVNPFDFNSRRDNDILIWISVDSWTKYLLFKQETCRTVNETVPDLRDPDFYLSGYYQWEDYNFHRSLRVLLYPETSKDSLLSLVDSGAIHTIDTRLLQRPPDSMCIEKQRDLPDEVVKTEASKFEDQILNRAFDRPQVFDKSKGVKIEISPTMDFSEIQWYRGEDRRDVMDATPKLLK